MNTCSASDAAAARALLLRWFRKHARPLPWRESKSAYRVWLSEIMLQQTQIATVIPYYQRFLKMFPSVESLAQAPLERVLELWSGLGYYRRARHLHLAARAVAENHRGQFPSDFDGMRSLAGVGDYTARAVLSIAYNQPYAVLDGNVARVMARFLALRGSLSQPGFRNKVEQNLDILLSRRQPGDFNQALMELGQTVCLPRLPHCHACPLQRWCKAFSQGAPESYPLPRSRRQTEEHHLATAVISKGTQWMLVRGLDEGLLGDLWNFPAALCETKTASLAKLKKKLRAILGSPLRLQGPAQKLRHNITFRAIQVHLYKAAFTGEIKVNHVRWMTRQEISRSAVSQLARKIVQNLDELA